MAEAQSARTIRRRVITVVVLFFAMLIGGTLGYRLVAEPRYTLFDCLYMTVITVATIGYGEIIDLSQNPAGRVFTMFLAFVGIGIFTYVLSSVTVLAADEDIRRWWRRRKMDTAIGKLSGHFIICGWSRVALQIIRELVSTGRDVVIVAEDRAEVARQAGDALAPLVLEGDVTSDAMLGEAGIARAGGVFATAEEDHLNIVICLSARQMNPSVRIVAGVKDTAQTEKMKKAGANAVVSAVSIGGLRMASEMIRPAVVSFLDTMLRGTTETLRVEEIAAGPSRVGQDLAALRLDRFARSLLLAVRSGGEWRFHPPSDHRIAAGDVLIVMTTPEDRQALEAHLRE